MTDPAMERADLATARLGSGSKKKLARVALGSGNPFMCSAAMDDISLAETALRLDVPRLDVEKLLSTTIRFKNESLDVCDVAARLDSADFLVWVRGRLVRYRILPNSSTKLSITRAGMRQRHS